MKAINKTAQKTFDKLVALIPEGDQSVTVDNSEGAYMAVHVEEIGENYLGPVYSIAHYYQQNGDLVSDPDMTFVQGTDGRAYPLSFEMGGRIFQQSVIVEGESFRYAKRQQGEQASFAGQWMKNIKQQQDL